MNLGVGVRPHVCKRPPPQRSWILTADQDSSLSRYKSRSCRPYLHSTAHSPHTSQPVSQQQSCASNSSSSPPSLPPASPHPALSRGSLSSSSAAARPTPATRARRDFSRSVDDPPTTLARAADRDSWCIHSASVSASSAVSPAPERGGTRTGGFSRYVKYDSHADEWLTQTCSPLDGPSDAALPATAQV